MVRAISGFNPIYPAGLPAVLPEQAVQRVGGKVPAGKTSADVTKDLESLQDIGESEQKVMRDRMEVLAQKDVVNKQITDITRLTVLTNPQKRELNNLKFKLDALNEKAVSLNAKMTELETGRGNIVNDLIADEGLQVRYLPATGGPGDKAGPGGTTGPGGVTHKAFLGGGPPPTAV